MNTKQPLLSLTFVAYLLLTGCDDSPNNNRLIGQLESDRVELTAEVWEPITERLVVEGQSVTRGEALLQQDSSRAQSRLEEANAALQQVRARHDELVRGPRKESILAAQASVRGAQKELEFRQTDLARAEEVFARQLASPEVLDRATVARDTARANLENLQARLEELLSGTTAEELRQAEEGVRQAESRVELMRIDIERHTTRAPADGVVDSLLFEPGERPATGQPMAIMLTGEQAYARVYVPETMRVHIRPGTEARVYVDGLDTVLRGRVRWIASEAAFTPYFALTERDRGRLSFPAKIDLIDQRERLPDGVPVEVELIPGPGNE